MDWVAYNKILTTEIYFSQFCRLEVRDQFGSRVGWELSLGPQTSRCILTCWRGLASSLEPFALTRQAVSPFVRVLLSGFNHLLKVSHANVITSGDRIPTYVNFKGGDYSDRRTGGPQRSSAAPRSWERAWPCWHLNFKLLPSRTVGEYISVTMSHLVCGSLLQQS